MYFRTVNFISETYYLWHLNNYCAATGWIVGSDAEARKLYVVLPKNSGYLNRAPEPVVVCPSAARCG